MEERYCALEKMGLIRFGQKIIRRFSENKPSVAFKQMIYDFSTRERKKHFGPENPDIVIYIIRGYNYKSRFCIAPMHNLLANYFYVVSHMFYAKSKGWYPVIDQQNYPVYNSMDYPINGTMNAWEYFWKQPGNISLEEAYKSKNVVLSRQNFFSQWDLGYAVENYYDRRKILEFNKISHLVPLNEIIKQQVDNAKEVFPKNKRILGVNVRLGAHSVHSVIHGVGHPIQPEVDELIDIIKEKEKDWNTDIVFLASDTEYAVKKFKESFGDRLVTYQRQRAELGKEYKNDPEKEMYKKSNLYQTTLDYLIEMELLACCDSLIGSVTSGFRYAVVQNGGQYSNIEVIDCGTFAK